MLFILALPTESTMAAFDKTSCDVCPYNVSIQIFLIRPLEISEKLKHEGIVTPFHRIGFRDVHFLSLLKNSTDALKRETEHLKYVYTKKMRLQNNMDEMRGVLKRWSDKEIKTVKENLLLDFIIDDALIQEAKEFGIPDMDPIAVISYRRADVDGVTKAGIVRWYDCREYLKRQDVVLSTDFSYLVLDWERLNLVSCKSGNMSFGNVYTSTETGRNFLKKCEVKSV